MKLFATIVLILAASTSARAGTYTFGTPSNWDFSFSTDTADCTLLVQSCADIEAHGTFSLQLITPIVTSGPSCEHGSWFQIVGMIGEMNGNPLSFSPVADPTTTCEDQLLASHNMQPSTQYHFDPIRFSTGSDHWVILGEDLNPHFIILVDSNENSTILNWSVVQEQVVTPEPGSLLLLLIGFAAPFLIQITRTAKNICGRVAHT
jgi:hypothetical protein